MSSRLPIAIAAALLAHIVWSATDAGPQPPCGGEQSPHYPSLDQPPLTRVWQRNELGPDWQPPSCTGWTQPGFTTLAETAGRFRSDSGLEGLKQAVGAISSLKGLVYWSTTHQRWQPLIVDAYAITAAKDGQRRGDFTAHELEPGSRLYFEQEDSLSGKGTYELHVLSVSPDRLVFDTRNLTTLRYLLVPVFHPGDVESVYFLARESAHTWRYYNLTRLGENANGLAAGHPSSSVNRAVALFRHLAGIPADKEPPAAP